ncbi:MAG: hypothetical protein KF752_12145 [Pirellulaceae bacterium]|nr:hypothetical protein [Pirellulaceae bacterium]
MPQLDVIEPALLGTDILSVVQAAPLPGLDDQPKCSLTTKRVARLISEQSVSGHVAAALWLLACDLERSHAISQLLHDPSGSYWHAIMHRREGDYSNSKYWIRQAGRHPVFSQLAHVVRQRQPELAEELANQPTASRQSNSDAAWVESLVDTVHYACTCTSARSDLMVLVGWWEWQLLFAYALQP